MNIKEILLECKEVHKNKYNYSKVTYVNAKTKVVIGCPEHGDFEQLLYSHKNGFGCNECALIVRANKRRLSQDDFIEQCKNVHGDYYDYSLVNYTKIKNNINIICPRHGKFEQTADDHKNGRGCVKCYRSKQSENNLKENTESFIDRLNSEFPNNDYDFSEVNYIHGKSKVIITCPIHGRFERKPNLILDSKKICLGCSPKKIASNRITTEEFIIRAIKIHGNKYDYSKVVYKSPKSKIIIICPEHGEFKQSAYNHINPINFRGCNECGKKYDKSENEVSDFITTLGIDFEKNNRLILNGKELDIYIPSLNVAIEYNGLYWHSELHKDNNYHLDKTIECEKLGIQLIHIFEDEWLDKREIVESRLKNILGLTNIKVFGRKCVVREIPTKECRLFFDMNHLQGYTNSKYKLGLYYNDELISAMLFTTPRLGIGAKFDGYELTRFVNKLNTSVVGGAGKLLKHFIKTYNPNEIRSYADRRWSDGGLYNKLNFIKMNINKPNYWYVKGLKRYHRFNFRKGKLNDMGYNIEGKTEREIMLEAGYLRIHDCGTMQYILKP
jgi:hypothetical protein